jgi:hypothetical protein
MMLASTERMPQVQHQFVEELSLSLLVPQVQTVKADSEQTKAHLHNRLAAAIAKLLCQTPCPKFIQTITNSIPPAQAPGCCDRTCINVTPHPLSTVHPDI